MYNELMKEKEIIYYDFASKVSFFEFIQDEFKNAEILIENSDIVEVNRDVR